jgi:type VI secretion system secreted protein VgrG
VPDDRPFTVTIQDAGSLLLDRFEGSESISNPFRFILRVLAGDTSVDIQSLLTKPVVLSILLDSNSRQIHGNINRMKLLEFSHDGKAAYEIEMVPWFWFLNLFSDCRIFQYKSVIEIVQAVFSSRGFTDFAVRTTGTYNTRDYCVQYRETDFNFVSRLLEEEGIFYFFEHTEDKHTLVLGDDSSAFVACPDQAVANFALATGAVLKQSTVFTLEAEYQVRIGKTSQTDYDFTKPKSSLMSTLDGERPGEVYDYPGNYTTKDDGDRYSRIRLEALEVGISTVRGGSNVAGFQCGYTFTLKEHINGDLNKAYLLVALEHQGHNTSYRAGEQDPYDYQNRFEAIPASVPYRPARRARRPVMDGPQTAVVVGKSGEEIWTDQYGRVKVQFFWDRVGTKDGNSSCWIRVAQGWAGKQWGFIALPRVGQEVVVSFLEGDPDRPLITGSVYNADQTVPYSLPDNQTQSTWKSMSSKGGDGFNEIRYEDKKGSEQIFIHGEKDMDMRIKNDRREWIGEDRHLVVVRDKLEKTGRDSHLDLTRDHIEKIGRDHNLTISGKEAISITGSHSLSVTGDVIEEFKGNHSSQVTQNLYLKGMKVVIEGMMGLTINVGGSFITINAGGVQIQGPMVMINSGGSALSGSPGSLVSPQSPTVATDASDAPPGQQTTVAPATAATPASMTLATISPVAGSSPAAGAAAGGDPAGGASAGPAPLTQLPLASDAPTHYSDAPENQDKKSTITIKLTDSDGDPIAGEPYKVTLPDNSVADGTLDDKGTATINNIDPGTCQVTFPQRDKTVLKPK